MLATTYLLFYQFRPSIQYASKMVIGHTFWHLVLVGASFIYSSFWALVRRYKVLMGTYDSSFLTPSAYTIPREPALQ